MNLTNETITTHDVSVNGVLFIMELQLRDDGTSYMTLTEACNHPEEDDELGENNDSCSHRAYDFAEVVA